MRPGGPRRRRTGRGQVAGRPRGRPCGAPRVDSGIEEIKTINRGIHPPIYTRQFVFFSPCGTMFPHGFSFCRTRGDAPDVGFYLNGYDRVDPSPCDH